MLYETKFLVSLGVTSLIEVPIVVGLVKFVFAEKKNSWNRVIGFAILASALTLPYLWFVLAPFVDARYYLEIGEFLVFLIEGILFWWGLNLKWYKAFVVSFAANLISYYLGLYILKIVF